MVEVSNNKLLLLALVAVVGFIVFQNCSITCSMPGCNKMKSLTPSTTNDGFTFSSDPTQSRANVASCNSMALDFFNSCRASGAQGCEEETDTQHVLCLQQATA